MRSLIKAAGDLYNHSEKMRELWADPNGPFKNNSEKFKELWADPNGPFKNVGEKFKELWADPNGPFKNHGKKMSELRADPDGPFKNQGKKLSELRADPDGPFKNNGKKLSTLWADPEGPYKNHNQKIGLTKLTKNAKKLSENLIRWKPTLEDPVYICNRWIAKTNAKANIAPRASTLERDLVLAYFLLALKFMGVTPPTDLEKSQAGLPKVRGGCWPQEGAGLDQEPYIKACEDLSWPPVVPAEDLKKLKPGVDLKGHNAVRANLWRFARIALFAEDLIEHAQTDLEVAGLSKVNYVSRLGHWEK